MAFHIHQDNVHDIFTCRSSFTPFVPPPAMVSLQDHIPDIEKLERKKNNDIEYLPGEKLLIKLNKEKRKNKKKQGHNIDIDRIQKRLTSVLKVF